MNLSGVEFVRDGVALRSSSDPVYLRLLGLVVLMCLCERAYRVRIARTGNESQMHAVGPDGPFDLVPPPTHITNELYRVLAEGDPPCPRWWDVRTWFAAPPKPVAVPPCWSGEIEARFGVSRVPISCDLIAYPDGVSIVLEIGGTAAERADYARAAEVARAAWLERSQAAAVKKYGPRAS